MPFFLSTSATYDFLHQEGSLVYMYPAWCGETSCGGARTLFFLSRPTGNQHELPVHRRPRHGQNHSRPPRRAHVQAARSNPLGRGGILLSIGPDHRVSNRRERLRLAGGGPRRTNPPFIETWPFRVVMALLPAYPDRVSCSTPEGDALRSATLSKSSGSRREL